jgi:hypothetical protein
MRLGDDWDDFDDFEDEEQPQEPERKGFLTTRTIIVGVVVAAVVAIVVGRLIVHQQPQSPEAPQQLIGLWTCDDQARSDHYVEFGRDFVIFGTGGTGSYKCRLLGSDQEAVGDLKQYTVYYRDMAGTRHIKDLVFDAARNTIRFTDEPRISYSRFQQ